MELNKYIEHTLLKVDCVNAQVVELLNEAIRHNFYGICIPPYYVPFVKDALQNNDIKLISVTGFALGYEHYKVKCEALKQLAKDGVDEVDVVTNIAAIKNKQWQYLKEEWQTLIETARAHYLPIKIIIESGLMSEQELAKLCDLANELQPNFIKTSTGFNGVGAELEKVIFLRKHLHNSIKIKASGGVKNAEQAKNFIRAGASRIGTSSGVRIVSN